MILCGGHPTGELPFFNAFDLGILGSGGLSLSGAADINVTRDHVGSGGLTYSGSADINVTRDHVGSGGLTYSGSAGLGDYTIKTEAED